MADPKSRAYIYKVVATVLGEPAKVCEEAVPDDLMAQFLEARVTDGKRVDKLMFYAQDKGVICTPGDAEPLKGKCAFVVRLSQQAVSVPENDINFGTVKGSSTDVLQTLSKLMSEVRSVSVVEYVRLRQKDEAVRERRAGVARKAVRCRD
jgi:hypothetical protein